MKAQDVAVLAIPAAVMLSVTAAVSKRCPIKDERDDGTATLTWNTMGGHTLELHDVRAYLSSYQDSAMTHEQWCAVVAVDLSNRLGSEVRVESTWLTAGMGVRVALHGHPLGAEGPGSHG